MEEDTPVKKQDSIRNTHSPLKIVFIAVGCIIVLFFLINFLIWAAARIQPTQQPLNRQPTPTPLFQAINVSTIAKIDLPKGTFPVSIAVNSETNQVFVADGNNGKLIIIDSNQNKVVDRKEIDPITGKSAIATDSLNNKLYVLSSEFGKVYVLDKTLYSPFPAIDVPNGSGGIPTGMAIDPNTNNIYLVAGGGLVEITSYGTITDLISFPSSMNTGFGVAVNSLSNDIFIGTVKMNKLTKKIEKTISLPTNVYPVAIAVNDKNNHVYIAHQTGIIVADGNTGTILGNIPAPVHGVISVAVNKKTGYLYILNEGIISAGDAPSTYSVSVLKDSISQASTNTQTSQPSPTITLTPTPSPPIPGTWVRYTNEQFGFSMTVPYFEKIYYSTGFLSLSPYNISMQFVEKDTFTNTVKNYPPSIQEIAQQQGMLPPTNVQNITVDGQNAFVGDSIGKNNMQRDINMHFVALTNDKGVYIFVLDKLASQKSLTLERDMTVFNYILSTFKLTSSSDTGIQVGQPLVSKDQALEIAKKNGFIASDLIVDEGTIYKSTDSTHVQGITTIRIHSCSQNKTMHLDPTTGAVLQFRDETWCGGTP